MALSNRERVGKGFELLAEGLEPFIDRVMSKAAPPGTNWTDLLAARQQARHGSAKKFSKTDPQVQLKVLTEEWRAFGDQLSRVDQSFASELRDARNGWAHNESFSGDDTYRALDTMERLLVSAGSPEKAEEIRKLRLDLQRTQYDQEARRTARINAPKVEGVGTKSWREVIPPHADVAEGDFSAAEFAADLYRVAHGEGAPEYLDPVEFFARTYLTEGLRDLLTSAARRLSGDGNAKPVINLQTTFGGGKTHSMLALYHLFSGIPVTELPQEVQDLLAGTSLPADIRRAVLVGNWLKPGEPSIKPDGTAVNTIWGELAWQLGGADGYAIVAEADRLRTPPGDHLDVLLRTFSPCVVLIDEWVAYARALYGRDDLVGGTFDDQFTFAQTLTECAKAHPVLLAVSIPASSGPGGSSGSDIEVGGHNGQEALRRLQKAVDRVADHWQPASSHESFEIVRRRLFEPPDASAKREIAAVAKQFAAFYQQHAGEFPRGCADLDYEKRIRDSYPIHPDLFDRLYEDWSTLEKFQRTRGVLRLMSCVVHELWVAGDSGPLIMAGSVPVADPRVLTEISAYLPDSWKPIIDTDIDGENSTSVRIDKSRPALGQRSVTRRVARSIFVGSAPTLASPNKGLERQNIWLGVAVPGDVVGNFGSALDLLRQQSSFLYEDHARYWYDTQASVTRKAQDYADNLRQYPETVWVEIIRRLREIEGRASADFAGVHICPDDSGDVADSEDARLVILHPQFVHARGSDDSTALGFAQRCLETRGSAQRTNRNTLAFLAPDHKRLEELDEAVRHYLAWDHFAGRTDEDNLTAQQAKQVQHRRVQADQTATDRLRGAYIWALVPQQPDPAQPPVINAVKAEGSQRHLAERVSAKLRQGGDLATTYGARNVRMDLDQALRNAWVDGFINFGVLRSYYARYPYLTRLRDHAVLESAVRSVLNEIGWEYEGFALATGFEDGEFIGLAIPHRDTFGPISDTTVLVRPDLALLQVEMNELKKPGISPDPDPGPGPAPGPVPDEVITRFFGVRTLRSDLPARDFGQIMQEVIQHLSGVEGTTVTVRLEIAAENSEGFSPDTVRTVSENAKTLKFDQQGFEDQ